jgi:hypothetical protein
MADQQSVNRSVANDPQTRVPAPAPKTDEQTGESQTGTNLPLRGSRSFGRNTKIIAEFVAPIVALIGILVGVMAWIDHRIESKLSDEGTLRTIASRLRPSLIFNAKGSIIQDMGAVQYLKVDDIKVIERFRFDQNDSPQKIHVGFLKPVAFPPILTSMKENAAITASRAKGLDWEFVITWIVAPMGTNDEERVFRLEITP